MCGLKPPVAGAALVHPLVTPFVGVWIETRNARKSLHAFSEVTPFVGVWIETAVVKSAPSFSPSHPSWVCGLKLCTRLSDAAGQVVTPFVGVWIETRSISGTLMLQRSSHPSWVCGLKPQSENAVD